MAATGAAILFSPAAQERPDTMRAPPLHLAASARGEPDWLPEFGGLPGTDLGISALAVFDDGRGPALYVGGRFLSAGGVLANAIARWDGVRWSALGAGMSSVAFFRVVEVRALAVFDDGGGPALYAAGVFTDAGNTTVNNIAKWDGTRWTALGTGLNSWANALAVFDDGSGPALYAGGFFSLGGGVAANNIARWDGASWSALGDGLLGSLAGTGHVDALTTFDDGSGPALYAGGVFSMAGGVAADNVAKWDGSSWSAVGAGLGSPIHALTTFDDGSGPALYAGGAFATGGSATAGVARWDGSSWVVLGNGASVVAAFAIFDDGSGPALYASGAGLERWDGAAWRSVEPSLSGSALAVFHDGDRPALFAGGLFAMAGGVRASNIAAWNGSSWAALGQGGLDGAVNALAVFADDHGPALYLGGEFTRAGGVEASHIVKWDGSAWSALGSGTDAPVHALAMFDDGTGPALYAGGVFTAAGGTEAQSIARWDGKRWFALEGGASGSISRTGSAGVFALAVFDDGGGPALYAGGNLTVPGNDGVSDVAKWNATGWHAVGRGTYRGVLAFAVFDDDRGPALYAGGGFNSFGSVRATGIAKWNGEHWSELGAGLSPIPYSYAAAPHALAVFDDGNGPALYAGGEFTRAGGIPANHIARWNGASWSALGTGTDQVVNALAAFDDGEGPALFVGGKFLSAGSVASNRIAKWNGAEFTALGSGVGGLGRSGSLTALPEVRALTVFDDGTGPALYAGGAFTASPAGDSFVAKWGCATPRGTRTLGASSPGCDGSLALGVTSAPRSGNASFALHCSHAPPRAAGAMVLGTALATPLHVQGADVWVNPVLSLDVASDAHGNAHIVLPLRADPELAGKEVAVQLFWFGPGTPLPCPPFGWSASNALVLTMQP